MSEWVDLDVVQRHYDDARALASQLIPSEAAVMLLRSQMDVPALVAELRAAREVVEAARHVLRPSLPSDQTRRNLRAAVDAYDQATAPPDPAAGHADPERPP